MPLNPLAAKAIAKASQDPYDSLSEAKGISPESTLSKKDEQDLLNKLGSLTGTIQPQNALAKALWQISKQRIMKVYPELVRALENHPDILKLLASFSKEGNTAGVYANRMNIPGREFPIVDMVVNPKVSSQVKNPFAVMAHETIGHGTQDLLMNKLRGSFPGTSWKELNSFGGNYPHEVFPSLIEEMFPPHVSGYGKPQITDPTKYIDAIRQMTAPYLKGK